MSDETIIVSTNIGQIEQPKNNPCYLCINEKETNKCKVCHQIICNDHFTYNKYCIKCYNEKTNYDFYPSPPPMLPSFKHQSSYNKSHNKKETTMI
jgi:hypothetical protein